MGILFFFVIILQMRFYWLRSKVYRHFNFQILSPKSEELYIVFTYPRATFCFSLNLLQRCSIHKLGKFSLQPHIIITCSQSSIPLNHNFMPHTVHTQNKISIIKIEKTQKNNLKNILKMFCSIKEYVQFSHVLKFNFHS